MTSEVTGEAPGGVPRAASTQDLFARYGPSYRWLATLTVMTGTIATVLSSTIVNVALPDMMGAFGMGQDKAQLLAAGFLAAMTATMLVSAWMVDALGQRMTYVATLLAFLAGSTLGGLAPSEGVLVLARILEGGAAGMLQPLAMQVIFQVFPPDKRGAAMGIYGIGVVLAPALGPVLGGLVVDTFSWRYVFFLPLPFCVLGILLGTVFLPEREQAGPVRPFDWLGLGLLALFLLTLLDGLTHGQRDGWGSDRVVIVFAAALASAAAFLAWELHTPSPMLHLAMFANRTFAGAAIVSFIFGAGIFGSTFLIPLFVQIVQGYTPTRSGLLLMPGGLIMGIMFPLAGRLADRAPAYATTIMIGLGIFAVSSFLMASADTQTSFWQFAWWVVMGRVGLSFIMPSLSAGALRALPLHLIGQGSGTLNFTRQLGGAIGVNLLSVNLERRTQLYVDGFTSAQNAANATTTEFLKGVGELLAQSGLPAAQWQASATNHLGQVIYAQANVLGYRDSFFVVGCIFVVGLLPALLMGRRRGAR
ncbi:MAG: multidrug efflux MFS transporter [Burkholderiaceae bacterium]|nr:multidrug efflux MFS transporter [Burkholderiaceae bacterium]